MRRDASRSGQRSPPRPRRCRAPAGCSLLDALIRCARRPILPNDCCRTLEGSTPPLQHARDCRRAIAIPVQSRQTPAGAAAIVSHRSAEETMATTVEADTRPEVRPGVRIEDVEYQRQGGRALLARLYRPAANSPGPYPAVLQVHGGAWVHKDRTDNDFIAKALAESGILVASIDFRMPPEASYPASLSDINLATRWLKARARLYGSRPDWVGSIGTSSGGHQVLLAAMRPDDPRYCALPLAEAPDFDPRGIDTRGIDAQVAFVISGW